MFLIFSLLLFQALLNPCFAGTADNGDKDLQVINDGPYLFKRGRQLLVLHIRADQIETRFVNPGRKYFKVESPVFDFELKIPLKPARPEPSQFKGAAKIFVMSDIHGQETRFKNLLIKNKVVNKRLKWIWGKNHLVILGDVFDRGPKVTEILWTIYHLEQQARKKGGCVHFLLGNHEKMVLQHDLRYLHPKYLKVQTLLNVTISDLHGPESVLGQWLRTRNTFLKINDIIFVHGGISPVTLDLELHIKDTNSIVHYNIDTPEEVIKNYYILDFIFSSDGPFWYRGLIDHQGGPNQLNEPDVNRILKYFAVNKIIVGHTTLKDISSMFNGKVICVDAGIKYSDQGEALLYQNNQFFIAGVTGEPVLLK